MIVRSRAIETPEKRGTYREWLPDVASRGSARHSGSRNAAQTEARPADIFTFGGYTLMRCW